MKKFILIIVASMVCSFMSYAQQEQKIGVDGFELGMSIGDAAYVIGKKGGYEVSNRNESNRWIEYKAKSGLISYTLYYDVSNKIYRIYKSDDTYNPTMLEEMYNSVYADILYKYGEPIIKGNTSMIWRGLNYKITLSYGSSTTPARSQWDRPITKYYITEDYQIIK